VIFTLLQRFVMRDKDALRERKIDRARRRTEAGVR
jgi:hypothetical protein